MVSVYSTRIIEHLYVPIHALIGGQIGSNGKCGICRSDGFGNNVVFLMGGIESVFTKYPLRKRALTQCQRVP